jgi:hypothetical protein
MDVTGEKKLVESELDPGIRKTVKWLNINGFKVVAAEDGDNSTGLGYSHVYIGIDIYSMRSDGDKLAAMIKRVCPNATPDIEAIYNPKHNRAVIALYRFHDDDLALASTDKTG